MSKEAIDYNALRLQHTVFIPGWTKEDKLKLYTALREFGSSNIVSVSTYLQKSPTEVRQAIEIYKKRAIACSGLKKSKAVPVKPELRNIPLDKWARLLMANSTPEQLQSETSNAIKLIAELESIPKPNFSENINFKNIYLLIADAMEGKPLKPNSVAQNIIHRCIIDSAYYSKIIAKKTRVRNILNKAVDFKTPSSFFFQCSDDLETCIVSKLLTLQAYNPLNIPIDALKTTLAQETKLFPTTE